MIKFCAKLFALLLNFIHTSPLVASATRGLNNLANVMIVANLASKEPFIKIADKVLFVPKKCIGIARYTVEFLQKHKFISFGVLAALGFSIFKLARADFAKEGVNGIKEFFRNIFLFSGREDEEGDYSRLLTEYSNLSFQEGDFTFPEKETDRIPVSVSFFDFDGSGEVSVSEYKLGVSLIKSLKRIDPNVLYVFQNIAEKDIDFIQLLKKAGVYRYESFRQENF